MRKVLNFLLVLVAIFALVGCGNKDKDNDNENNNNQQTVTKHTVQFYVEDELYKTFKIEDNTVIGADKVANPVKEGHEFLGWYNGEVEYKDLSDQCVKHIKDAGFDCVTLAGARLYRTVGDA